MAFVTASQMTQYDNAGHLEMYRYDPATRKLVCVSCIPSGAPPTSDVAASQDGLFMTDDGRAFFTTEDALVHADTNKAQDVYEYVDGRPQLITPGTGRHAAVGSASGSAAMPGLVGVSANGTDVYFSTYDTLVRQDHNGLFLKFYDARSGGGFPAPAPPPPCEAADECHGVGSPPPPPIQNGTGALARRRRQRRRRPRRRRHARKHHKHRHEHKQRACRTGRHEPGGGSDERPRSLHHAAPGAASRSARR